ncbi:MAG TPA: trimethylamine methyltransferase family protein [Ruminiclostridium sp.]
MIRIQSKIEVLSQSELEMIHRTTLKVLETVGIAVPNAEVLDLCEKLGGKIDREKNILRIPSKVLNDLLAEVKAAKIMDPEDFTPKILEGQISTQVFMYDYIKKEQRYGTLDDVNKGIALVEQLKNIPTCNAVTIPADVPKFVTDLVSYQNIMV